MNQVDIEKQAKALEEAAKTMRVLYGKLQARDMLVDELENEVFRLKNAKSRQKSQNVNEL